MGVWVPKTGTIATNCGWHQEEHLANLFIASLTFHRLEIRCLLLLDSRNQIFWGVGKSNAVLSINCQLHGYLDPYSSSMKGVHSRFSISQILTDWWLEFSFDINSGIIDWATIANIAVAGMLCFHRTGKVSNCYVNSPIGMEWIRCERMRCHAQTC